MSTNLKSIISKVRDELVSMDLERREKGHDPLLQLEAVEIEIHFTVEQTNAVKGGFDLKVISLGAKDAYREEEVQTVRLKLVVASSNNPDAPLGSLHQGTSREETGVEPLE